MTHPLSARDGRRRPQDPDPEGLTSTEVPALPSRADFLRGFLYNPHARVC